MHYIQLGQSFSNRKNQNNLTATQDYCFIDKGIEMVMNRYSGYLYQILFTLRMHLLVLTSDCLSNFHPASYSVYKIFPLR